MKKERSLTVDGGFGMTALNNGNGDGKIKRAERRAGLNARPYECFVTLCAESGLATSCRSGRSLASEVLLLRRIAGTLALLTCRSLGRRRILPVPLCCSAGRW